nr:MAG TPA_asm: hypothetical protein [Caudoviricetes sp.]
MYTTSPVWSFLSSRPSLRRVMRSLSLISGEIIAVNFVLSVWGMMIVRPVSRGRGSILPKWGKWSSQIALADKLLLEDELHAALPDMAALDDEIPVGSHFQFVVTVEGDGVGAEGKVDAGLFGVVKVKGRADFAHCHDRFLLCMKNEWCEWGYTKGNQAYMREAASWAAFSRTMDS